MNYGEVLFPGKKDNYIQNLREIEDLLKKTFDLEQLLIDEDPFTETTIFKFEFKRNRSVGCIIDNSQIRMRKTEDTARDIAYLVVDKLI